MLVHLSRAPLDVRLPDVLYYTLHDAFSCHFPLCELRVRYFLTPGLLAALSLHGDIWTTGFPYLEGPRDKSPTCIHMPYTCGLIIILYLCTVTWLPHWYKSNIMSHSLIGSSGCEATRSIVWWVRHFQVPALLAALSLYGDIQTMGFPILIVPLGHELT